MSGCASIRAIGTVGESQAAGGGSVPVAIVMSRTGMDREPAERRLAEAGGRISKAIAGEESHG